MIKTIVAIVLSVLAAVGLGYAYMHAHTHAQADRQARHACNTGVRVRMWTCMHVCRYGLFYARRNPGQIRAVLKSYMMCEGMLLLGIVLEVLDYTGSLPARTHTHVRVSLLKCYQSVTELRCRTVTGMLPDCVPNCLQAILLFSRTFLPPVMST